MRTREVASAIYNINKAKKKLKRINETYPQRYVEELYLIGDDVITQWYSLYDPIFYERRGSLYDMFDVKLNGTDYIVEFKDDSLTGLDKYLYDLTFVEGYHGGAKRGVSHMYNNGKVIASFPHPHEGVPYWKTPIPQFYQWGRPALRSFSPYYRMVNRMEKKIKELDDQKQKEIDDIMKEVTKSLDKIKI